MAQRRDQKTEAPDINGKERGMGTPRVLCSQLRSLGDMAVQLGILFFMCSFGVFLFVVSILSDQ